MVVRLLAWWGLGKRLGNVSTAGSHEKQAKD